MTALTDSLAEGAVQTVLEAGELLADPAAVRSIRAKSETDYVTNVDLAVQEFLREKTSIRKVIFNVFQERDADLYRALLGPDRAPEG